MVVGGIFPKTFTTMLPRRTSVLAISHAVWKLHVSVVVGLITIDWDVVSLR